jgi:hypothetical protein
MGGVVVYPRYGAQLPGTGQRWVGGFGYGAIGPFGAQTAGPAVAGLQTYRPRDPAGGWVEMTQVMPVRAGVLNGYGTSMTYPCQPWPACTGDPKYKAMLDERAAARDWKQAYVAAANAPADKPDVRLASAAVARAQHAHEVATPEDKDRTAENVAEAKFAEVDARLALAERGGKALLRALAAAQERLANAQAAGDTAAVARLRRLIGHLGTLRAKFERIRAHVAAMHGRLKAVKSGLAKPRTQPVTFTADSRGMVGPDGAQAPTRGVVLPKSPMAGAAEVVASPVMQGYAGFGAVEAGGDAAVLEDTAVAQAEALAVAIERGDDPEGLLGQIEVTLAHAAQAEGAERAAPLAPGVMGTGTLLAVAGGLALLFLLRR